MKQNEIEPELIPILAGEFWMGSDRRAVERAELWWEGWMHHETPAHRLYLPAYTIGHYPVTNAEFAHCVKDGGYRHRQFWTQAGWQFLEEWKVNEPEYWQDKNGTSPIYRWRG